MSSWLKRILGLEAPAPLPARPSAPIARSVPMLDRWMTHPSVGATPERISQIYREAEQGWPARQCELFDDAVGRDGHLRSALEGRVLSVAGKGWIIVPGGDSDADKVAAAALESALRSVPNFQEMMEHQLKATWYGYSLSEIQWDLRGGLNVPVWFANIPHVRFRFDAEDYPRLLTASNLTDGVALEPGHWMYTRMSGRVAAASGLMRTALWLSYFKKLAFRDWLVFSERFGMPYVAGKYDALTPADEKQVLAQAVGALGKEGGAIFSKAAEIEITQAAQGGKAEDVQGALARFCDDEISELITGSTLTSRSGGPGSFALGRVHADRSFEIVLSDAERLAHRFEQDIGVPFVAFNGLNARPPRLKIHVIRDYDPMVRAQTLQILQTMGLALDTDQVRQEFQIKPPTGAALTPPPVKVIP